MQPSSVPSPLGNQVMVVTPTVTPPPEQFVMSRGRELANTALITKRKATANPAVRMVPFCILMRISCGAIVLKKLFWRSSGVIVPPCYAEHLSHFEQLAE